MKSKFGAVFLVFSFCLISKGAEQLTPSQQIDQLVDAGLRKQGIEPNSEIRDEVFLRRTYLNIAGRVPTIEEVEKFHTNTYPNKRERLVDDLLHSEGHVSHAFHFWADLLRMNGEPSRGALGNAYELWVKEAIRSNMPYNEMVYSLVTAEGKFWDNGAVGYYFRDRGMPLDNMSNTVRVFLGTRLECAQCHNHPFDKWTQMDYFKMASFSFGMNTKNYDTPNRNKVPSYLHDEGRAAYLAKAKELTGHDNFPYISSEKTLQRYIQKTQEKTELPEAKSDQTKRKNKRKRSRLSMHESVGLTKTEFVEVVKQCINAGGENLLTLQSSRDVLKELYNPLQYTSVTVGDKNAKLPHDYQYTDANPHDQIKADTMFGEDIDLSLTDSKIQAYGKWMTSPDNPTFTKVIANRLWKEVFGIGIFEPVDELTDHTYYSNPELLAYLEKHMKELNYDTRAFLQTLYNTKAYQRAAFQGELEMGAPYYFQGPVLRRMSAEQIWDSLVALALPEADRYQPKVKSMVSSIDKVKRIYQSLEDRPFDEYIAMVKELAPLLSERRKTDEENRAKLNAAKESGDDEAVRKLRKEVTGSKKAIYRTISDIAYTHLKEDVEPDDLLLAMGIMDVRIDDLMDESEGDQREIMTKLPKVEVKRSSKAKKGSRNENSRSEARAQKEDYKIYRRLISDMARASELDSPARRGHFLRDFGQSDREVIENASDHASVPQALNLLNGPMVESLTNPWSVFGNRLASAETTEEKAKLMFQGMLTRQPTIEEIEIVKDEVENNGGESYEGIVWALLNTRQFMFIQ